MNRGTARPCVRHSFVRAKVGVPWDRLVDRSRSRRHETGSRLGGWMGGGGMGWYAHHTIRSGILWYGSHRGAQGRGASGVQPIRSERGGAQGSETARRVGLIMIIMRLRSRV